MNSDKTALSALFLFTVAISGAPGIVLGAGLAMSFVLLFRAESLSPRCRGDRAHRVRCCRRRAVPASLGQRNTPGRRGLGGAGRRIMGARAHQQVRQAVLA